MPVSRKKLAVITLGKKNSGKSNTWYKLFNKSKMYTRKRLRPLFFNSIEYTQVFLLNGSMEERNREIENELIDCDILLCSVQYSQKGKKTIEYLHNQGFQLCVYWLNPGCSDRQKYDDELKIIDMVQSYSDSVVKVYKAIRDDNDTKFRSEDINRYIYNWAKQYQLIYT
ncbi:hypothetical protein WMO40_20485 [Bacillaceae bacterium CLA-AA-H227]|uniref:Uncharacterized protein n=1 Tax=Robertmurraya yapensis (ex Hitch et al 2024) TaxID=3133160 RepID=A0ACC6SG26_9BACI